jgi:hypothetical protein
LELPRLMLPTHAIQALRPTALALTLLGPTCRI